MLPTFRTKHRMRTKNIKFTWQILEQDILGEFFNRQDIHEKGTALEPLKRERHEYLFGGEYGSAKDDDFGVALAEVMWVREEVDAEVTRDGGVVSARVGQEGVALAAECLGEKLAEVSEAEDADLKRLRSE
uniref:Uncharacterized protein n=1 Tax=Rhizophora mucronata TaxID=61149 RepID=A0A2P2PR46_RHIMU